MMSNEGRRTDRVFFYRTLSSVLPTTHNAPLSLLGFPVSVKSPPHFLNRFGPGFSPRTLGSGPKFRVNNRSLLWRSYRLLRYWSDLYSLCGDPLPPPPHSPSFNLKCHNRCSNPPPLRPPHLGKRFRAVVYNLWLQGRPVYSCYFTLETVFCGQTRGNITLWNYCSI